jgi:AcrR family transcriptional regulator
MQKRPSSTTRPGKASRRASSPRAKSPTRPDSSAEVDGRRARGDRTRARILDAALRTASTVGLNSVTIGQLAEAARVSKGHLALLFGNREQLQLATLDAAIARFRARVLRGAGEEPSAFKRLERYCLGWFDYVADRVLPGGCFVTAVSSEFRGIHGAVRDRLIVFRREMQADLRAGIIAAADEGGTAKRIDAADLVHRILAFRAAANVASLLGDTAAFEHARESTRRILREIQGS